jgi:hypothetical protein
MPFVNQVNQDMPAGNHFPALRRLSPKPTYLDAEPILKSLKQSDLCFKAGRLAGRRQRLPINGGFLKMRSFRGLYFN